MAVTDGLRIWRTPLVPLLSMYLLLIDLISGTPVQYCKTSAPHDFCVAFEAFPNTTTSKNDLYISFQTTRDTASAEGWSAIGLGPSMVGALMFVMYGDPQSKTGPVVSVRTATGYSMPNTVATDGSVGGVETRILNTGFIGTRDDPKRTLSSQIVWYDFESWKTSIASDPTLTTSTYQPFVYAANEDQDFSGSFVEDAAISAHSTNGGMGYFWADMAKATTPATSKAVPGSAPSITSKKSNVETTESDPAAIKPVPMRTRLWQLHGTLLSISFLLLHPFGVIIIRGSLPGNTFKYHWTVQAVASTISFAGILVGILTSRGYTLWHQYIGFLLLFSIVAQAFLGWRHHVTFLRIRRRTWMTLTHDWLGRIILMAGWFNIILGMILKHWTTGGILMALALEAMIGGMIFFSGFVVAIMSRYRRIDGEPGITVLGDRSGSRKATAAAASSSTHADSAGIEDQDWGDYLAMSDQDDSDRDDNNGKNDRSNLAYSSQAHGAMPSTGLMSGIPATGLDEPPDDATDAKNAGKSAASAAAAKDKRTWLPTGRK